MYGLRRAARPALLVLALVLVALSTALTPTATAGTSPVGGKYRSYVYIAVSRSGPAVYVNALVHQDYRTGIVDSPNRVVYLQRLLKGGWQNMLVRHTNAAGRFTVGFLSAPSFSYRLVAVPGGSTWGASSVAASSPVLGSVLRPGQSLTAGSGTSSLASPSQEFALTVEQGASISLWQSETFPSIAKTVFGLVWAITGVPAPGAHDRSRLTMQPDGNLVLHSAIGKALWSSRTSGAGNSLYVQDDGNLVMYSPASHPLWSSGTTRVLLLAGSVIPSGARYVSHTHPQSSPAAIGRLEMQRDGNLVLYGGAAPVWSSNTHVAGSHAAFTSGGILAIYSPKNQLLWRSASYGPYSSMTLLCGQLLLTSRDGSMQYLPSDTAPPGCYG